MYTFNLIRGEYFTLAELQSSSVDCCFTFCIPLFQIIREEAQLFKNSIYNLGLNGFPYNVDITGKKI